MAAAHTGWSRDPRLRAFAWLAVVAVALALRLMGATDHTLTHAEVYVPRLEMPDYVSAPPPRATLAETLRGSLHHDNHPPGYYAFMWAWTGLAGTGLLALRLPSILAGAATVALLFGLVRRRDGDAVALLAAALLATHGHHLYWSQQARMWVFLGCFALLSVLLLERLHRRWRATNAIAYVAVVAAGLWFEYSFWPFVAAQIFWEAARSSDSPHAPATLDLQLLSVVTALPVMGFLNIHLASGRTEYLARTDLVEHLGGFFLLQWWLRGPTPPAMLVPLASLGVLALLVACTALFAAGVANARAVDDAQPVPAARTPGLGAAWRAARRPLRALRRHAGLRRAIDDPASVHALLPLAILTTGALFVPSVAARSLLFLTPFALWLVARGLLAWLRAPALRVAAVALLLAIAIVSVRQYTEPRAEHHDYQGLAAKLRPATRPGDLILIHDAWWTQPMHYYLPPARFHTGDFGAHARELAQRGDARPARFWFVIFDDRDVAAFAALQPRLGDYRESRRIDASAAYAVLFERRAGAGPAVD